MKLARLYSFETDNGEGRFEDVQTDEEWAMLDELLENYLGDDQDEDDASDDDDEEA